MVLERPDGALEILARHRVKQVPVVLGISSAMKRRFRATGRL